MTIYEYGTPDADTVLIQLTGDHELSVLENEVEEIRKRTSIDFRFIAAKVDDWNYELSPWKAPAVFGNEDFGVAAASPSAWFPGFIDYVKEHEIKSETVYLSLGDREERTRNPLMSQVGNCIQEGYDWLMKCGINCTLEWNQGNHFREPDIRTAKAFAWVMAENHRV
nr:esterase [uncultured Blautia sp.]